MPFNLRKINFGRKSPEPTQEIGEVDGVAGDQGEGLPSPFLLKVQARRAAGMREAATVLAHLPDPGESLHFLCTARLDLSDVLGLLLGRYGTCERMLIATLGFNPRNLKAMLGWLDAGAVHSLTLLSAIFLRANKPDLWREALTEFRSRKQRAACCHSHAKVVTLAFASGKRLCIEGSANMCGNGSGREQFALINDAGLHDWHAGWIDELVTKHEGDAWKNAPTGTGEDAAGTDAPLFPEKAA